MTNISKTIEISCTQKITVKRILYTEQIKECDADLNINSK